MSLTLHVAGAGRQLTLSPARLIVAGYTAKDEAAVAAHIAELANIGVPPPPSVPTFYDLDPSLLTTDARVVVPSASTSGEVEPVLVRHDGRFYLAVGSDHTDRELEKSSIADSKAVCPKPIGDTVAAIPDPSSVDWDEIAAESTVDGTSYQQGSIAALRYPVDLLDRMKAEIGDVTGDLVLFCGTLPIVGGEFRYGASWRMQLALPGGPTLTHFYETEQRSV